jgi:hypothetical protein
MVFSLGAWAIWQGSGLKPPAAVAVSKPAPKPAEQPKPPQIAARLSTSFDAKWSNAQAIRLGDNVLEGASLDLESGVAQFDMADGATVVVEGPSRLQFTGPSSLKLEEGKTAVRIDSAAESFVVDAPTMQVVDLGTEFGVEASSAGVSRVMVFDGTVALNDAGSNELEQKASAESDLGNRIGAGFEVRVDRSAALKPSAELAKPVTNPRHFLRPDEVNVRLRALAGSLADRQLAAHFERQRIEGLLAYQGFDASSSGLEQSLGVGRQGLQPHANMKFVENADGTSGGIEVQGGPVFMSLDTSVDGSFARAGLLADSGRIGRSGTELWLTWRTRRVKAEPTQLGSAGVSLMFGEQSDMDEPMFFGRGYGEIKTFCAQSAWGNAAPPDGERVTAEVDFDAQAQGVQSREVDDDEHVWVTRLEFRNGADRVSVWVDPDLKQLETLPPQGVIDSAEVEFDRLRLAVNRGGAVWRFGQFAAATSAGALEKLTHVAAFRADK